jgi:hypothetical protein
MIVRFNITTRFLTRDFGQRVHKVEVIYKNVRRERAQQLKRQHPGAQVLRSIALV